MRKKGSITKAKCWRCDVINQNEVIFSGEYSTLKEIANELGLTYSQILEIYSNRKKQPSGRYDTNYVLTKLSAEKLNIEEEEDIGDDNPSMNGF